MSDARAAAEKADEKSADRLTTLSDGIFAIAMTLLVLDLHVEPGLDKDEFIDAVRRALPDLGACALSFTILAGFWRDHRERAGGMEGRAERERDGPAPVRTYRPRRLLPAGRRWGDPAVRSRCRPVTRTAHPHSILISYLR